MNCAIPPDTLSNTVIQLATNRGPPLNEISVMGRIFGCGMRTIWQCQCCLCSVGAAASFTSPTAALHVYESSVAVTMVFALPRVEQWAFIRMEALLTLLY